MAIKFFLLPGFNGRPPRLAACDRRGKFDGGLLPLRGARHCEPLRLAASLGYWAFPPAPGCAVAWDGKRVFWSSDGENFEPLSDAAPLPGGLAAWDALAPPDLRGEGKMTPFLTALPEPGMLQLALWLSARTDEDELLLVRGPANFPGDMPVEYFEGVVDTSVYGGPLFVNVRITKTDSPFLLHGDRPLAQLQVVPRRALLQLREPPAVVQPEEWGEAGWGAYRTSIDEKQAGRPERPFGEAAAAARRAQAAWEKGV